MFCLDDWWILLPLIVFLIRGFVILSKIGDGECCSLVGDVGTVIDGCTLRVFTTFYALVSGSDGWVMIPGHGLGF